MNLLVATSFFFGTFLTGSHELKIKSDAVKIEFTEGKDTHGSIGGFQASILFDVNDLTNSSISGTVDVNTINTGTPKRDEHLKTADYFDATKFPTMGFKSTSISKEGDSFVMKGQMTIKDITREESITFTYADNTFKGSSQVHLSDYKVGSYAKKTAEQSTVKINFMVPVM